MTIIRVKYYLSLLAFSLRKGFLLLALVSSVFAFAQDDETLSPVLEKARELHRDSKSDELLAHVEPLLADKAFKGRIERELLNMLVHAHLYKGDFDIAYDINKRLQKVSRETGDNLYLGKSLLNEAEMTQQQGVMNNTLQLQRQALQYYRKTNNKEFIAHALLEISYTLEQTNENIEALNYANQSLQIGEDIEHIGTIASAWHAIGMIHKNMGNMELALEAHQKTIQLDRERGDESELATSYFNIADIFMKMENYEQATFYTNEALRLDLEGGNPAFLGHDYSRLAELAIKQEKYQLAREHALAAMEYFKKPGAVGLMGKVHNLLAIASHKLGDADLANSHLSKAMEINSDVENPKEVTHSNIIKAEILLDSGKYDESLQIIAEALPYAIERKGFEQIKNLFMLKSKVYEAMNDHQRALLALKDYYQLKENFDAENRIGILAQLQNQMDFLHKEHQIEMLESQSSVRQLQLERARLEKNQWIIGLVLCVLLVGVFLYRERTKRVMAAMEKELLADSINKKNAMLAEVAHELRSPLTALKLQVESLQYNLEDDPDAAYHRLNNKVTELNELIEDLYDLARADNGLLKLNKESVSVQDLVEDITEGYQEVVEHRGLKLKTQLQVSDSDYFTVDALRIKQVIVNLIRNSINYTNAPGTICCTAKTRDQKCEIILEDSAPGVPGEEIPRLFERMYRADSSMEKDESGSGLGLSICKSLVEAHNGEIKASNSELGGLRVKISLPMTKEAA